jgi:hypothetical protein
MQSGDAFGKYERQLERILQLVLRGVSGSSGSNIEIG